MASGSVIVHDIESLESYMGVLQSKRDDLEGLYGVLSAETSNQGGNWQDPQYDYLRDNYASSAQGQLSELDESINYISGLIAKLRDL